jgi:transcriptional regulator
MYIPKANEETRVSVMHDLIRAQSFASLVTMGVSSGSSGLVATHLPMVLEIDSGTGLGTLKAHVARGNTQWRDFTPSIDALAIFAGPHHYISASWYPNAHASGAEVPTWNYAVVHAYGPLKAIDDPGWLLAHLQSLTNEHESGFPDAWDLAKAPDGYIAQQMRGIVGLELPIRRLEGKWKASQNRNERDREAVMRGLLSLNTPDSLEMKQMLEERRPEKRPVPSLPPEA